MSPQLKRIGIGGFVLAATLLLVLSAIAVAHRDARNHPPDTLLGEPDYAQQAIQPVSAPEPFEQPEEHDRQFPHGDLMQSDIAFISQTTQADAARPPLMSEVPSNPLRSESYSQESDLEDYQAEANIEFVDESTYVASDESESFEDDDVSEEAVSTAQWEDDGATDVNVAQTSGFDLPNPNQATQANTNAPSNGPRLLPPPQPAYSPVGSTSTLPPSNPSAAMTVPPMSVPSTSPALNTAPLKNSQPAASLAAPSFSMPSPTPSTTASAPSLAVPYPQLTTSAQATNTPPSLRSSPSTSFETEQPPQSIATTQADTAYVPTSRSNPPNIAKLEPDVAPNFPPANFQTNMDSPAPRNTRSTPPPAATLTSSARGMNNPDLIDANETYFSDRPGERLLDGVQTPNLQIIKEAPEEIQVGHPATFTIIVKNTGRASAHNVTVQDKLPQGTTLESTQPPADVSTDNRLVWALGTIPAGAQQVLTIHAVPETEGEIGSVASVNFTAQASVRTVATQPKLTIRQQSDPTVLIGDTCMVRMTVANEGSGVAYDVRIEEDVPAGFRHPNGTSLEVGLNDLAPGQSRTVDLELEAVEAGQRSNVVSVYASNMDRTTAEIPIEVIAPKLQVKADGPRMRYLERQATYQVTIANTGTAMAQNIHLVAYLPKGLRFNSAGNLGEYLPDQHAVIWNLPELDANKQAVTDLVVMPVQEGEFVLRFQTRAERTTSEPFEKQVRVDGQSELSFSVEDDNDPIEVDDQTTYLIRLHNIGTRRDSNVKVQVQLPDGATLLSMSAPVEYQSKPGSIVFSPIPTMEPKDEQVIRFTVGLAREGMHTMRVSVMSDQRPVEVVKEESTQVYSDR
jgi:uncharacterized repeat protein (TIGR01451 family)